MDNEHVEPATRFSPRDAPSGSRNDLTESYQRFYRRLSAWHGANGDWKWSDQQRVTKRDRRAIFDALAGQLELKQFQRDRALRILDDYPKEKLGAHPTALLCLVVAALSAREDGRHFHPDRDDAANDDLFQSLLVELDFGDQQFRRLYRKVEALTDG